MVVTLDRENGEEEEAYPFSPRGRVDVNGKEAKGREKFRHIVVSKAEEI